MKGLYFLAFVSGAAIGATISWMTLKEKYEARAREEIDSVKAEFKAARVKERKKKETIEAAEEASDKLAKGVNASASQVKMYNKIVKDQGYSTNEVKEERKRTDEKPYEITADELGELDGYEIISLTWYADGILADDGDDILDNPEDAVGEDYAYALDYAEKDEIYIRNPARRCDYEICKDYRTYEVVTGNKPHLRIE